MAKSKEQGKHRHALHNRELQKVEKYLATLTSGRISPALQQFIATVLNMTENGVKVGIRQNHIAYSQQVQDSQKQFQVCSDQLNAGVLGGTSKFAKLNGIKLEWEACIYDKLVEGNLTTGAKDITTVDWSYVEYQLSIMDDPHKKKELDPYITGDWTHREADDADCSRPGTSASLTGFTCQERANRCGDFEDTNNKHGFAQCSGTRPRFMKTDLPTTCRDNGGCCDDPDASECDYMEGSYSSKGAYFKAMGDYWRSMLVLWNESKAMCEQWSEWCCGNQTVCAIDPAPYGCDDVMATLTAKQIKVPSADGSAPAPAPTPAPFEESSCLSFQDAMDNLACEGTIDALEACNAYNDCYRMAGKDLTSTWTQICAKGGDLDALKQEWAGALRIECVMHAVEVDDATSMKSGIEACNKKEFPKDYDLSAFEIPACYYGSPGPASRANPTCRALADFEHFRDCSGTPAYRSHYYQHANWPRGCSSFCCTNGVVPYQFVDKHDVFNETV